MRKLINKSVTSLYKTHPIFKANFKSKKIVPYTQGNTVFNSGKNKYAYKGD